MSTDTEVDFNIKLVSGTINRLLPKKSDYGCNLLEKTFKLYTTQTETNMYLFDHNQQLLKFENVYDIIDSYFPIRLDLYQKRKDYMIRQLEREVMILHNKARFIEEQCEDIIDLRRKKKAQVIGMLKERSYDVIDEDEDYKYLRSMRIEQVEEENIKKLRDERDSKIKELDILKKTTPEAMWESELNTLLIQYKLYRQNRINRNKGTPKSKRIIKKKKGKAKIKINK